MPVPCRCLVLTFAAVLAAAPETLRAEEKYPAPAGDAAAPPEGKITKEPVLRKFVEAPYPQAALDAGIAGEVQLAIEIDETGAVKAVTVLAPAGHGFDEAAVDAAKRFTFEPAAIDGKPAPVKIIYRYKFTLERQAVARPEAPGGPVNFTGVVKEKGTRTPIPLAGLSLEPSDEKGKPLPGGTAFEATAGDDGTFSFRALPEGHYRVTIMAADFYRFETVDDVAPGKVTEVTYYVQRLSYDRFETVVRGKKEKKEVAKRTLELEEIQKIAGTGGDAIRVVQNLPGVARTPLNTGGLIVRGSSPKDTIVFLDGIMIPILFHFMGLTSVYNSDLLETLDFMPGGFSVHEGNAAAGIVELKSRTPRTDRLHGYLDVNLFETSAMVEGPITERSSFYAAARRSYIDFVLQAVADNVEGLDMMVAPWYYDYQAKYRYVPGRKDEYAVQAYGSRDEMRMVFDKPVALSMGGTFAAESEFHRLTGTWLHRAAGLTSLLTVSPGYNRQRLNVMSQYLLDMTTTDLVMRNDLSAPVNGRLTLNGGLELYTALVGYTGNSPRDPGEEDRAGGPKVQNLQVYSWGQDVRIFNPAGYLEAEIKPDPRWKLIPGLRLTYFDWMNELAAEPRLAVWFKVDDDTSLKGQAGVYRTYPWLWYTVPGLGNRRLHSEGARQYSAGVERKLFEYVSADLQVFYKEMYDLAVRTFDTVERNGVAAPLVYANEGAGRAYGLELLVKHDVSKYFFGWLAYTLSRSERKEKPGTEYVLSMYDQTHILTLIGVFKLPANWDLGFRFRLVSGNPCSPLDSGGRFDSDYGNYWPIRTSKNTDRMPVFHQLDVRVDKRFIFDRWILDAYLDVLNVYNYRSIEGVDYNYDYTKMSYVRGLPVIPTLGVKAEF